MSTLGGIQSRTETSRFKRGENGNVAGHDLVHALANRLAKPCPVHFRANDPGRYDAWREEFDEAVRAALPHLKLYDPVHQIFRAHLHGPRVRNAIAGLLDVDHDFLWPTPSARHEPAAEKITPREVIARSAEAFRTAIDALPVGRDIRARLSAHIDAHIALIETVA